MIRYTFAFFTVLICSLLFAQKQIVTLEGYAQNCANCKATVYEIEDYLSLKSNTLASTTVKVDSTFEINFFIEKTQKVKVEIGKNYFYMYMQPNGKYDIYVRDKSPYNAYRPEGNLVEYFFGGDLDSLDINYKTITFEDEVLTFLKKNYRRTSAQQNDFVKALDIFKEKISEKYKTDTSVYFKTYVRYGIASLDDLNFTGSRNKYEKYDFYIKPFTVYYHNDRYMEYIGNFYDDYHSKLSNASNNAFYEGVVNTSPTMIMNALQNDYALKNVRLRELITIKILGDIYNSPDYPQTNVLMVLDSISNHALFKANKKIASNIKRRLVELTPGSKAPNYSLIVNNEKRTRTDYLNQYHYIQFVNEDYETSLSEIALLTNIEERYNKKIKFTTVVVSDKFEEKDLDKLKKKSNANWDITVVKANNTILEQFDINTFPTYALIDKQGYIVALPALGPKPNGNRETIEKVFLPILRINDNRD